MDIVKYNKSAWDSYVDKKNRWTVAVSDEEIMEAKQGKWSVILTPTLSVPYSWFPTDLKKIKILGLACGGGQQGPILAALGANVTIFDNSPKQLGQDTKMAAKHNLPIDTIEGDMRDLSVFADESFDLIFNPCSIGFVDDILAIWKECYRVLKKDGILMTGLTNPLIFQIDEVTMRLKHKAPYSDKQSLSKEELDKYMNNNEPLMFGHSWTDQIGGQLQAGFMLTDMYEDNWDNTHLFDAYFPGFMATRSIKK